MTSCARRTIRRLCRPRQAGGASSPCARCRSRTCTGLFVQLALREQVNQLQPLTPTFKEGESGASNVAWGDGNSTWELWWEKISRYIRIDFNAG